MKTLGLLILSAIINGLALWLASYYIPGVSISGGLTAFIVLALIFTVINTFIKPIVKLIFGPIIFITLGLGIILVNALMLYLLDFLSPNITIIGLMSLIYATLLISVVNVIGGILLKASK